MAAPALLVALRPAIAARNAVVLVFGNSSYRNLAPLANPRRDAEAIGAIFQALGAATEVVLDVPRAGMVASLSRFADRAARSEVALVFFAGHGIQRRDKNWLVPVDADPTSARDVPATMVPLEHVIRATARAGQRIVILDACRDDPFPENAAPGLAQVEDAGAGTLIAFATSPGRVALDGEGQHSPFTDALLDHLGTPGLDLRQVLTRVRRRVLITTSGQQVPWDTSSLTADIVLRGAGQSPIARPAIAVSMGRPARPLPPSAQPQRQPSGPAPVQGEVSYDPTRYREITATYARARAAGHVLPDGLLVQRRNIEGRETPLTGSYAFENDVAIFILLGYNEQRGNGSIIISTSPRHRSRMAAWWQARGIVSGTHIRQIDDNGNTWGSLDTRTGWANIMRQRNVNYTRPIQARFARIE
jgi:hypothetical protein